MPPPRHPTHGRYVGRLIATDHPPRSAPPLARFLTENQCPHCLGWNDLERALAAQIAGRPGRMRHCVCAGADGQQQLDFGGAA